MGTSLLLAWHVGVEVIHNIAAISSANTGVSLKSVFMMSTQ
jgi:hypothetical protein